MENGSTARWGRGVHRFPKSEKRGSFSWHTFAGHINNFKVECISDVGKIREIKGP